MHYLRRIAFKTKKMQNLFRSYKDLYDRKYFVQKDEEGGGGAEKC
jgi:hypothetical protein